MVAGLTPREIDDLKMKFLIKLKELSQNRLQSSIKKEEVWDEIPAGAYNKELIMPMIVQKLMDDGFLIEGNTKDEVTLTKIKKSRESIQILELFNGIVNSTHEGRIGVTLNTNGLIVSRNLISLKKFYKEKPG